MGKFKIENDKKYVINEINNIKYEHRFIIIQIIDGVFKKYISNIKEHRNNSIKIEMGHMEYIIIDLNLCEIYIELIKDKRIFYFYGKDTIFIICFKENRKKIEEKYLSTDKVDKIIKDIIKNKKK